MDEQGHGEAGHSNRDQIRAEVERIAGMIGHRGAPDEIEAEIGRLAAKCEIGGITPDMLRDELGKIERARKMGVEAARAARKRGWRFPEIGEPYIESRGIVPKNEPDGEDCSARDQLYRARDNHRDAINTLVSKICAAGGNQSPAGETVPQIPSPRRRREVTIVKFFEDCKILYPTTPPSKRTVEKWVAGQSTPRTPPPPDFKPELLKDARAYEHWFVSAKAELKINEFIRPWDVSNIDTDSSLIRNRPK